jgi:DNA-binding Lrp family transcriptional regulator
LITAIILARADRDQIPETAERLLDLPGVAEVYSVAGDWDLVAIVRVKHHEQVAEIVADKMLKVPGIERTTTLVAFKSYSRKDLEHMWEIGLEE